MKQNVMEKPATTKQQAQAYVLRVGKVEAKKSVHYATAAICHCGSCFCCEVKNEVQSMD